MPDCIYTYQVSMCSCKVCVLFSAGAQVLIPCSLSSAQGSQGMCWFWLCWAIPGVKRRGHQLQASRDGERSHCSSFSDFLPCAFLLMAKKNTNWILEAWPAKDVVAWENSAVIQILIFCFSICLLSFHKRSLWIMGYSIVKNWLGNCLGKLSLRYGTCF